MLQATFPGIGGFRGGPLKAEDQGCLHTLTSTGNWAVLPK